MKLAFLFSGRLTHDAVLKDVSGKSLMTFTIAVNDYYKKQNATEFHTDVTFIECKYWRSPSESQRARLTKGSLVQVDGFIKLQVYKPEDKGEHISKLTCNVEDYVIHVHAKANQDFDSVPIIDEVPVRYFEDLERLL